MESGYNECKFCVCTFFFTRGTEHGFVFKTVEFKDFYLMLVVHLQVNNVSHAWFYTHVHQVGTF